VTRCRTPSPRRTGGCGRLAAVSEATGGAATQGLRGATGGAATQGLRGATGGAATQGLRGATGGVATQGLRGGCRAEGGGVARE